MKKSKFWRVVVILAILAVFVRMGLNDSLTVREYTVSTDKVTEAHTFALLTDLHSTSFSEDQSELIELVTQHHPDAVLMVGDFADNSRDIAPSRVLITALADQYPCYFVTGNHERWCDISADMKMYFASIGAFPLAEDSVDLTFGADVIRLHGIDDPLFYDSTDDFLSALAQLQVSDRHFDLLLSHRPEHAALYAELGFELTVSGHAHGGQWRLPVGLNGLYAPAQGWFPTYAGGKYSFENGDVIVSRGLMIDEKPRFYNPPEVVIIHVVPAEA